MKSTFDCHCVKLDFMVTVFTCLQYQLDMETFSESLKRINSTMEPRLLENMSNLEKQMHIEVRFLFQFRNQEIALSF